MDKIGKPGNFEEVHFLPVSAPVLLRIEYFIEFENVVFYTSTNRDFKPHFLIRNVKFCFQKYHFFIIAFGYFGQKWENSDCLLVYLLHKGKKEKSIKNQKKFDYLVPKRDQSAV